MHDLRALSRLCRYAWAAPCSAVGLGCALVVCALGGRLQVRQGVLEVAAARPARRRALPFAAITLGHVVLARDEATLARCRAHERVHVRQYECWGPVFFLAYPVASAVQLLRGRHPYRCNWFEVQARVRSGSP